MAHSSVTIRVPGEPERGYEIRIGSGLLGSVPSDVAEMLPGMRQFVVTDVNLVNHGHLAAMVGEGTEDVYVIDPPGENSKMLSTVENIISEMEQKRFGRDSVILALGGGVVGDIAGFAAAIFKRGIPCVQIPATTVAQADSAVGGKTGVDSELSKNAYGTFHHPAAVFIDCSLVKTMDDVSYRAGLVESVKHAMIADPEYFRYIESNIDMILERDEAALHHLAEKNCGIKGRVVEEDPNEKNLRRILNFGHTIGHAVESLSGFDLLHGEAVSIGIVGACRISQEMGLVSAEVTECAVEILQRLDMPVTITGLKKASVMETMKRDKKSIGGVPKFVVLDDIGTVHGVDGQYAVDVPAEIVEKVLSALDAK
jgi:3-dehydroquinate synthase